MENLQKQHESSLNSARLLNKQLRVRDKAENEKMKMKQSEADKRLQKLRKNKTETLKQDEIIDKEDREEVESQRKNQFTPETVDPTVTEEMLREAAAAKIEVT